MAMYRSCINERPRSSPRNDDNMLRASCLKRQLPELNTQPPVIIYPPPGRPVSSSGLATRRRGYALTPTSYIRIFAHATTFLRDGHNALFFFLLLRPPVYPLPPVIWLCFSASCLVTCSSKGGCPAPAAPRGAGSLIRSLEAERDRATMPVVRPSRIDRRRLDREIALANTSDSFQLNSSTPPGSVRCPTTASPITRARF